MNGKRLSIFATTAAVAVVGGGLWLAGGGGGGASAQDAATTTQPERGDARENGRGRDRGEDRDRDRDDNADPDRRERRERRRERERNRDDRDDAEAGDELRQEQPAAIGTGNAAEGSSTQPAAAPAPAPGRAQAPPPSSPARSSANAPARREDFVKQYAIVYEKNIFLRDRPTYNPNPTAVAPTTSSSAPRKPEESFVLTGIVLQEGRHVAFIENTGTGGTQRLLSGAEVAEGKVVEVERDALEFETGGKRTRIEVGRNLAGAVVFTPPPAAPAMAGPGGGAGQRPAAGAPPAAGVPAAPGAPGAPAAGGAAPGGPPDPNNPNLSVEERMKLRRAQQLSGGK